MGFIPEDRLGMGLIGSMDIVDNIILKDYQNAPGLFLKRSRYYEKANRIVDKLDIQTPGILPCEKVVRRQYTEGAFGQRN